MTRLAAIALFATTFAVPAARAGTWKVNLGAEAPIVAHDSTAGTTRWLTDDFQPALNLRLGYAPIDLLSFDAEISEQFWASPPPGRDSRIGTTLRVGITLEPPVLPLYFLAQVPLHLEPDPFTYGFRTGAGLTFNLLLARLYLEALLDFPLGGGTGSPDAFKRQIFSLGGGVQFRF
jgi:hypothetical protein